MSLLRIWRRLPTSATDTTRGRTHVERSTPRPCGLSCLRTAPAAFATLSVLSRGRRVPRVPLLAVHEARQRGTVPLRGLRAVRPEPKDPRVCGEPSSFLLTNTRLSPASRHVGLECLRRALAGRRSAFPLCPAKGAAFPQIKGAFHRTFHVPGGGFPR